MKSLDKGGRDDSGVWTMVLEILMLTHLRRSSVQECDALSVSTTAKHIFRPGIIL